MLRFQLIVPAPLTHAVDEILAAHAGSVSNVIRLPRAATAPRGDVLMCDVERGDATELLGDLHRVRLDAEGSISIESVDLALSRTAKATSAAVFGGEDDAVVWQEVEARAGDEVRLSATFIIYMVVAIMIAAIGVFSDQPILIVGAMVVGPDFGPLAAMAVGIVRRRPFVVGRSILALVAGYGIGILVTIPFSWLMVAMHLYTGDPFTQDHPLTAFIWQPNGLSYVVGFLAGIAGMLSLTSAKSGALIGVLISVTTVPAAGAAALALSYGEWHTVGTSLVQLVINLLAIVTGCTLTLLAQILLMNRAERRRAADATTGQARV
ncbi:DUF389 domain-containing protein [Humibacter ginsenosidimutans]|uniref:DUF389 domain-containing protein n=1 Tax=Humibacter ginsenosidimutans TaxID=2599293 RepID=A0A5B8M451_9MICO|nr:DUF389 domain-containing protein [Humibacter ginsenosidimutans]QDZ14739.1 DUF389 domain-containing protein [Humibacter ginsenosidimutans]